MTAQEYLQQHGINEDSIKRFHITWDENQVNIPIKNKEDKIIWTKHRNLNYSSDNKESQKYINDTGSKISLFNIRSHHDKKDIILTEGEMDAIRLDQEGIPSISNTGGAGSFNQQLADELKNKNIYIAYDNDEPGKTGIRRVLEFLPTAKVIELPLDSHDICDFFTLHTKKEFIELLEKAETGGNWKRKYQKPEYEIITGTQLYKMEFPEERWLIDKILPATGITMFVGESGVGKSFIATEIVRSLIEQDIFLDHFEVKSKAPILIIDKENGLRRIQKRMRDMGVPESEDIYLLKYPEQFTLDDEKIEFLQSISDFIKEKQIKVVILDSFVDVVIGSENDSGDTSKVFNAIKSIASDVCWVILHHDAKPIPRTQRTAGQKTRGSSNIIAQVDNQFYIEKPHNSIKVINIEQGKSRDNEPIAKFAVEFMSDAIGNMVGFKYVGEVKSEVNKVDEATDFVMGFLAINIDQSRQLIIDTADSEGISKTAVERALAALRDKKLIDSKSDPLKKSRKLYFILQPKTDDEVEQTTFIDTENYTSNDEDEV